jgi:hypothetical protein
MLHDFMIFDILRLESSRNLFLSYVIESGIKHHNTTLPLSYNKAWLMQGI